MGNKEIAQGKLQSLSKVLRIDLPYYLSGSFWLTTTGVASTLLSLILSAIFARLASQTLYGQYRFALAYFSLLSILSLPGLSTAITQAVAQGNDIAFVQGTRAKIRFSWLATAPLLGMALYLLVLKGSSLGWAFVLAIPLFPLVYGFANTAYFTGKKRFRETGLISIVQQGLVVISVCVTLLLSQSVVLVIIAYLLARAVVNIAVYERLLRTLRRIRSKPEDNAPGSPEELLRYGGHLTAMRVIANVAGQLDHILLAYFLSFQHVAVYAIANVIPEALKGLFKQINSLVLPRLTATPKDKVYLKVRTKTFPLLLLGALATAALWVALPVMLPFVYTSKYSGAVVPAQILALSLFFRPWIQAMLAALIAHRATRQLYGFYIVVPVSRILLLISLIPLFGVTGAALSLLASRALAAGYLYLAVRRMAR